MITKDKILEVLKKIIQNKKYKDDTYPKIILKCPANTSGENKMEKAFWNVYFVLDNYLHDLFCKVDDDWDYNEYQVAFTENGAYDMPSDYLDLDNLDAFYVDVSNALDVDGEYVIGCSGYYKSIEETDEVLKMSSKNSLIIDVDDFNAICDDLYIQALYEKTVDKLFNTDSYEYSFSADAKIVKAVCKAVDKYISNLSNVNSHHISHINTDEIASLPDDYNVKVTFYIEEEKVDTVTVLKYYAKFKKYNCSDIIKELEEETKLNDALLKNEINIDDFKHLVNGTLNEIDASVKLTVLTLFSEVADVYFIKSVKMVKDMLLYYANENYTVDINTSEYENICKNVDLNGFITAKFIVSIKPKTIKVEYEYYPTKEKMCESLRNTSCDKHSYRREVISNIYNILDRDNDFKNKKEELNCCEIKNLIHCTKNRVQSSHTFDTGHEKYNIKSLAKLIDKLLNPVKEFDILITTIQGNLDDNNISDNTHPDEIFNQFFDESIDIFDANIDDLDITLPNGGDSEYKYYNVHISYYAFDFSRYCDIHSIIRNLSQEVYILSQNQYKFLVKLFERYSANFIYCDTVEAIEDKINSILKNTEKENKEMTTRKVDNWKETLNEIFSEEKQKNEEIEKKSMKFSTKKELFNIVGNCALSGNDILVIANNNGFLDLVRANVVMENIFNLVHQEIPRVLIPTLNGKLYTDPIDLAKTLGNKGNPYLRYDCSKYSWEKSDDIHVISLIGSFTNETNKRNFTDSCGEMCTCINASDLFPIYLEIINEKEGNNNMKKDIKNNGAEKNTVASAPANTTMLPEIDRVYYNKSKKTVNIFWSNGTETKAITAEGDKFSLTAGIKECFIKYACGNNFDGVQKRIEDAKKKAVLTTSKEKKNKKSKVERLVEEVANANLTSDEKDDFVIALDKVINTETIKPVKQNKKGSK